MGIFYAPDRKAWRAWLKRNHGKESEVHLLKYKRHTGKPSLSHRDAMEEAICWGWIDTTVKRVDDETYTRTFRRRTDKSRWSNATLKCARDMIRKGLMRPEGLKRYREGLKRPVIDHGLPRNPQVPADLRRKLARSKRARVFWEGLAPSYRRYAIYWIENAKRPETRKRRVLDVYNQCLDGRKPGAAP